MWALAVSVVGIGGCGPDGCPYETRSGTARVKDLSPDGAPPGAVCEDPVKVVLDFIDQSGKVNPTISDAIMGRPTAPSWISKACAYEAGITIGSEYDVEIDRQVPAADGCPPFKSLVLEEDLLVCSSSCLKGN